MSKYYVCTPMCWLKLTLYRNLTIYKLAPNPKPLFAFEEILKRKTSCSSVALWPRVRCLSHREVMGSTLSSGTPQTVKVKAMAL